MGDATLPARTRVSDADREQVAVALREHCSAGRISSLEPDDRLQSAYTATRSDELEALVHDLPAPAAASRRFPLDLKLHAVIYVLANDLLLGVWLGGGHGPEIWPVWIALPWAALLAIHARAVWPRG